MVTPSTNQVHLPWKNFRENTLIWITGIWCRFGTVRGRFSLAGQPFNPGEWIWQAFQHFILLVVVVVAAITACAAVLFAVIVHAEADARRLLAAGRNSVWCAQRTICHLCWTIGNIGWGNCYWWHPIGRQNNIRIAEIFLGVNWRQYSIWITNVDARIMAIV